MDLWQKQISRATELAETVAGARDLLVFYLHVLPAQSQVYEFIGTQVWPFSGRLESDIALLLPSFAPILRAAETAGPPTLAEQACTLKNTNPGQIEQMLLS